MFLITFPLVAILIALMIVWLGGRFSALDPSGGAKRRRVLFYLLASIGILIHLSINTQSFVDGDYSIFTLALIPALDGLLALILVGWRDIKEVWKKERWLVSGLLIAILLLLVSTGRYQKAFPVPIVIAIPTAVAALVWEAGRHLTNRALEITGVLVASFLILDSTGLLASPTIMNTPSLDIIYNIAMVLSKMLALVLMAALIFKVNAPVDDLEIDHGVYQGIGKRRIGAIGVAFALLLALAMVEFRDAVLVEATGRGAEDHAPLIEFLLAILAGMVLAGVSPGRGRMAGYAFILIVPAVLLGAFSAGFLLDPQAITARRAGRIAQAVESYQVENGHYPTSLEALTPGDVPFILGPLTGRGQVWCYQGGQAYFRLGYVYFQRYYRDTIPEPYFEIRMHTVTGQPPDGPWMCDDELDKYKVTMGL